MEQKITTKETISYCGLMWIAGTVVALFGALLPYLYQEQLLNFSQAGMIRTISTFALAVSTLLTGWLMEIFKLTHVYAAGFFLMLLGCLLGIGGKNTESLCVMLVLLSFGNSVMQNAFNIDLNERTDSDLKAVNRVNAFFSAAGIATPVLLTGFMAAFGNWKYFIGLVAVLIAGLWYMTIRRLSVNQPKKAEKQHKEAAKEKNVKWSIVLLIVFMFGFSSLFQGLFSGWLTSFLTEGGLCTLQTAQMALSFFWFGNMLARFFWPVLFGFIDRNMVLLGAAIFGIICAGLVMLTHGWLVLLFAFLAGFCNGGYYPTLIADLGRYAVGRPSLFCGCIFGSYLISVGGDYMLGHLFETASVFTGFLLVPAASVVLALLGGMKLFLEGQKETK